MKKPSIWFWVISALGLIWNFFGAHDYIMRRMENAGYLAKFPQEILDYYNAVPFIVDVTLALAVWGGVLGWLLMLLRRSWAVPVFIITFLAMIINFGYTAATGGQALQAEHLGAGAYLFTAIIILLAAFAVWYSKRQKAKGILR